ncbi:thioredoxin family protein [Marinifilum sp. D714]|uniref:thioredoxin family protein n=1 Tax=Marinifilum sp. D714 TaxID=2937523 RepID=UPI0027D033BA|nr:thioredoxin family protein [Marinifilum sp. D714]MDQ2180626.1 thioredoxin family protein [Marinifilum sp. D714]
MIKSLLFFLFVGINLTAAAQNKTIEDTRLKKHVLYGRVTLEAFELDICKDWYGPEYKKYKAKNGIIKKLRKQSFEKIRIDLILGSWCHDSHREVPRFIKILDEIRFPFENLNMNALDTKKESPDYNAKVNHVSRVPTAIIYRNNEEIGRIIETPNQSLEKDLLKILSKN